jgi:tetratricopeptide (TPR) repeat protein
MKRLTYAALVATYVASASACSSTPKTAAGKAEATAGDEDLTMTAMARKVGPVQTPVNAAPQQEAKQPSIPHLVPKLAEVKPEGETNTGASMWGAPDTETGTPLPKRPTPNSASASAFRDGTSALKNGQLDLAKSAFARAVQADGKNYQAEYALGVVADRQGNSDEALQHYQRALQIQPDYEAAAQGAVNIYLRRGTPDAAVKFVEPLAKQWQRNLYLQALYADTLVRAERLDEAEAVARTALKRDERFVPAIVALAKASQRRGQVRGAARQAMAA